MTYQDDKILGPYINEWGCNFSSVLKIAEDQRGNPIYPQEELDIYKIAMDTGILQKEVKSPDGSPLDGCTVYDYESLFKLAGGKGVYLGKMDASHECKPGEREILEWFNPRTNFKHFTVGDGKGHCAWDPIGHSTNTNDGHSVTVKEGKVLSKRVFQLS